MTQKWIWVGINKNGCYIFLCVDDGELFKKLAEPVFFDIIGPFTDNEWRHYRHNIFNQFTSTETFFEYENWVELLNLLNNQKSKEPPKETKLDQYWIATTEAFCYVFCAIDDVKTFKKMAQSIFDSIIGPFRRQTFEKDAKHILERYQPLQIFYHYDNWKELLILMLQFDQKGSTCRQ